MVQGGLSKEAIRGAIQTEIHIGDLTIRQIATKFGVSIGTFQRWKDRSSVRSLSRKKKGKINMKVKNFIYKCAADKFTGIERASSRVIANKIKKKFRRDRIKVCHSTVNNCIKKILTKPRRARRTFVLNSEHKAKERNLLSISWTRTRCLNGWSYLVNRFSSLMKKGSSFTALSILRLTKSDLRKIVSGI